jgi:hypothetical protein
VSRRSFARRSTSAGFTLVELMVALTGGLFISLAVFALARDSGRFYQREARIANATVGGLLGFERLRTDIARAGFLASPNVVRDPRLCGAPQANWPSALRNLASIQVTAGTPNAALTLNGRTPPVIVLAGSYASADVFSVRVRPAGNATTFELESNQPALLRLGNQANPDNNTMAGVFAAGRALRIVQNGRQYYGQIIGSSGGAAPTVTIGPAPAIQFRSGSAIGCGLEEVWGSGASVATINVVNFIQYQLGTPQTPVGQASYQDVYASADGGPGEAQRTELMRLELGIDGVPIPGTEEIVAEYAVDLSLQLTAVSAITGCCNPTLAVVTPTDPLFPVFTAPVFGAANNTPERIRSVRVRLGVRSREGDRAATVTNPAGQGLFRFNLGTGNSEAFARVRTFQADVSLHNQADILW